MCLAGSGSYSLAAGKDGWFSWPTWPPSINLIVCENYRAEFSHGSFLSVPPLLSQNDGGSGAGNPPLFAVVSSLINSSIS